MRTLERPAVALALCTWGALLPSCGGLFPDHDLDEGMIDRAAYAVLAAQHTVALSDAILGLGGALDPALGLDAITTAIEARAAGACEDTQDVDGVLVVTDSPCVLSGGRTALATLAVRPTIDADSDGSDRVRVELDVLASLGGQRLVGHVSVRSRDGLDHQLVLDVRIGGHRVVASVTVRAVDGTFVIDGTARSTQGSTLTMILDSVAWTPGACYPSAGRIAGGDASRFQTIALGEHTTSWGQFRVEQEGLPADLGFMPSYGDCR